MNRMPSLQLHTASHTTMSHKHNTPHTTQHTPPSHVAVNWNIILSLVGSLAPRAHLGSGPRSAHSAHGHCDLRRTEWVQRVHQGRAPHGRVRHGVCRWEAKRGSGGRMGRELCAHQPRGTPLSRALLLPTGNARGAGSGGGLNEGHGGSRGAVRKTGKYPEKFGEVGRRTRGWGRRESRHCRHCTFGDGMRNSREG